MNTIEIIRTEKKEEEKTFSIGQMFLHNSTQALFMLIETQDNGVNLIALKSGALYDPCSINVNDFADITEDELNNILSRFLDDFTPVDVKITVTL